MTMTAELRDSLAHIPTATLSNVLFRRGHANCWVRASTPLFPDQKRAVGPAFTMRFVPARPDLLAPSSPKSVNIRLAIEEIPQGAVVVIDAMGFTGGGTIGDIMALRMTKKGVAALVTDGMTRDRQGIRRSALPVWSRGTAAPPVGVGLAFAGWQQTVGCGGVAVQPGDIIVADGDGALVIPCDMAAEVAAEALEAERLEEWIVRQVENGAALPGLYPPDAETLARFQRETADRGRR